MDDLAFYNRVLNANEIKASWMKAGDVTDKSMFVYYSFDEGPGATIFRNYGSAGSQADLQNGMVLGAKPYFETVSQTLRTANMLTTVQRNKSFCLICSAPLSPLPHHRSPDDDHHVSLIHHSSHFPLS